MFYSALVVDNVDVNLSGVIKVYVPTIMMKQKRNNAKSENKTIINSFNIINESSDDISTKNIKVTESHTIFAYPFNFVEQNSGTQIIPEIGSEVFIFFKDNDYDIAYYMSGNSYKNAQILDYGEIIEEKENAENPNLRVDHKVLLLTKSGHIICLNDTEVNNGILIKSSNKHKLEMKSTKNFSGIELKTEGDFKIILDDTNKGIIIKSKNGHFLSIDDKNGGINLNTNSGTRVTMDDDKKLMQIVTANGIGLEFDDNNNKLRIDSMDTEITTKNNCNLISEQKILLDSKVGVNLKSSKISQEAVSDINIKGASLSFNANGNINIECNGIVNVKGISVNVDAQQIELGKGAISYLLKGPEFLQYFATHTHGTSMGPSSPPVIPPPANILSTVTKTK